MRHLCATLCCSSHATTINYTNCSCTINISMRTSHNNHRRKSFNLQGLIFWNGFHIILHWFVVVSHCTIWYKKKLVQKHTVLKMQIHSNESVHLISTYAYVWNQNTGRMCSSVSVYVYFLFDRTERTQHTHTFTWTLSKNMWINIFLSVGFESVWASNF